MTSKDLFGSVDEFLKQYKRSGDAAYAAFRSVLERLDDSNTHSQTRIFLSDLQKHFGTKEDRNQCFQNYHFQIKDIFLDQYEGYQGRKKMTIIKVC